MEEDNTNMSGVRIYVGGLGESVTDNDLQRLFGSLGSVDGVDIIRTKGRSFAYVDFIPSTDEKSLPKLFSRYNGCLWKGGKLKLEKAREHYLERLKREWAEDTEIVIDNPETSLDPDRGILNGEITDREILKTKQLRIFFPKLRKVKSIPFSGTGKHKYSFQNIEAPPLPVHFCDCKEHSSPTATARGKQCYNGEAESGGMNDEEISIMNAVMNKLFEKEKVANTMLGEKEQTSHESPDDLQSNEYDADSASEEDDIILNIETKRKKTALIGSLELARMLENQESGLNKTRISEGDLNKSKLELQKKNNIAAGTKKKSRLTSESGRNVKMSANSGERRLMQTLPNGEGSGVQPAARDGLGESVKALWSQKSSWRELLNDGGNGAFSASQIMPDFASGKEERQQGPGDTCSPGSPIDKTDKMTTDGDLGNSLYNMEAASDLTEATPANKVAASNQSGRGSSWLRKQSWTQMVGGNNNTFSISQILPDTSFPKPAVVEPIVDFSKAMAKEPIADSTISNGCKHHGLGKHPDKESVSDGYNLIKSIPEKDRHSKGNEYTSAPSVERKAEKATMETFAADVKIGETCSFMRSATSLREWAKAKAAVSGSLKRKRSEK